MKSREVLRNVKCSKCGDTIPLFTLNIEDPTCLFCLGSDSFIPGTGCGNIFTEYQQDDAIPYVRWRDMNTTESQITTIPAMSIRRRINLHDQNCHQMSCDEIQKLKDDWHES